MAKRSIEQDIRNKNFGVRNGNYERNAVVRNPGTNSVYKEFLQIVGNGHPTGSVQKETIAVSATISISVEKLHSQIRLRFFWGGEGVEERNQSVTRDTKDKTPPPHIAKRSAKSGEGAVCPGEGGRWQGHQRSSEGPGTRDGKHPAPPAPPSQEG